MRFEDLNKSTEKPVVNKMALRLRGILASKLKSKASWSESVWANEFRMLIKSTSEARVNAALDWYDKHCDGKDPFVVKSAKGFRKHFEEILEPKVAKNIDQINVSPEASAIAEKVLRDRNWPYSSLANLPAAVQATIDGYVPLKTNLKDWLATNEKTVRAGLVGFVRMVQSRLSCRGCRPVETFCLDWFKTIHNEIKGWDRWSGDFSRFVFRKDVDLVNKFGAGLSFSYDGPYSRLWDWFKAEVWKS